MTAVTLFVFIAVAAGVGALATILARPRIARRIDSLAAASEPEAGWQTSMVGLVGPFARLSAPEGDWSRSPLRIRFIQAGIRQADARLLFFGAKTLLPLGAALLVYFPLTLSGVTGLSLLAWLAVVALAGTYVPNLYLALRASARKREVFENFPDAADLMLVCVEAGLGLDAALARVTGELQAKSPVLAGELHLAGLEMRAGGSREAALRNLAMRTGVEEVGTFATMLTQADKFGTSVGESLRVFSEDLRHKRQVRAEEAAAKIPTKMLFPLVLFIFPSIIMVVLGPAIVRMVRIIGPMLNGAS